MIEGEIRKRMMMGDATDSRNTHNDNNIHL